jgi:hypothetical protein
MDKQNIIQPHFDKLSHVLDELISTKGKMSNIEEATTFLGSMPKSYENLILAESSRVGILNKTLSLLLEEEARRKVNAQFGGDNENCALYGGSRLVGQIQIGQEGLIPSNLKTQIGRISNNSNNGLKKPLENCFYCKLLRHKIKNC